MNREIDFFFFFGSIYSYLTVMRIEKVAGAAKLQVRWRPFNLRELLIEQNNTAFTRNQVRMNYAWRDVERRAARHGIEFIERPPYPVDPNLLALRVGMIAAKEGWCPDYARATYRQWFVERKVPGLPDNVRDVLRGLGQPADSILGRAKSTEADELLARETGAARKIGLFGSPNVVVGDEIFWGDDRLEEAVEHATRQLEVFHETRAQVVASCISSRASSVRRPAWRRILRFLTGSTVPPSGATVWRSGGRASVHQRLQAGCGHGLCRACRQLERRGETGASCRWRMTLKRARASSGTFNTARPEIAAH